jgi:hypothetical protein
MNIGDYVLLHREAFPHLMMACDKPDEFRLVKIIESRGVHGMFGNDKFTGYRAFGLDDGLYYTLNWGSYPDDSRSPHWMWYRESSESSPEDYKSLIWYDVTIGIGYISFRPVFLDKYGKYIKYCGIHQKLYYQNCFYCDHCPEKGRPQPDYTWNGWRDV